MGDSEGLLSDLLGSRRLTVELELCLERRARLYAGRLNQRLAASGDTDLYDVDTDHELAQILMLLCETALDSDEEGCGLSRDPIAGHLTLRDVAAERFRRLSP